MEILKQMLEFNPSKRITALEILEKLISNELFFFNNK